MNKAQLVEAIMEQNKDINSKAQAERIVNSFTNIITEEVAKGGEVALLGFGTFKSTKRKERTARNIHTCETIKVPAKTVPAFKPGAVFKEKVMNNYA